MIPETEEAKLVPSEFGARVLETTRDAFNGIASEKDSQLTAHALLVVNGELAIVDCGPLMTGPQGKNLVDGLLRALCAQTGATAVAFVTEAWFLKSEEDVQGSLEHVPGRLDVVQVCLEEGTSLQLWHAVVSEEGGKRVLGEWDGSEDPDAEGRFVHLLPKKDPASPEVQ